MRSAPIFALPALLCAPAVLVAQPAAEPAPWRSVIEAQLDAFRAGDLGAAFGYAAPGIAAQFAGPEAFGEMVRRGYPMVWRNAQVQFLDGRDVGAQYAQPVLLTDGDGALHRLVYFMEETSEGWRIAGVSALAAGGTDA